MIFSYLLNMQSHPSWVCGLKQHNEVHNRRKAPSHPSWVCGLKLHISINSIKRMLVTPFVGVWIETIHSGTVSAYQ